MKTLHPNIQILKRAVAGGYASSSYDRPLDYRIKKGAAGDRVTEGYLSVWGVRDSYGTVAVKGCFAKSIRERGPESQAKNKIAFLWFHRIDEALGQFVELVEDDYGLRYKAVHDEVPRGEQALIQIRSGTLNQFSFGFRYVWDRMEYDERTNQILMHECDLFEGSVVNVDAANEETYAIRSKEDLEQKLNALNEEAEFVVASLPRAQQFEIRQLITRYKSLTMAAPPILAPGPGSPIDGVVAVGSYKLKLNQFLK